MKCKNAKRRTWDSQQRKKWKLVEELNASNAETLGCSAGQVIFHLNRHQKTGIHIKTQTKNEVEGNGQVKHWQHSWWKDYPACSDCYRLAGEDKWDDISSQRPSKGFIILPTHTVHSDSLTPCWHSTSCSLTSAANQRSRLWRIDLRPESSPLWHGSPCSSLLPVSFSQLLFLSTPLSNLLFFFFFHFPHNFPAEGSVFPPAAEHKELARRL